MNLSNLRDRGTKKWTAMMLPEHVKLLRDWYDEDNYTEKPELDEFELTLIAEVIEIAFKSKSTIKLTYWRDGQLIDDYGVPVEINTTSKSIVFNDPFGTSRYQFDEIVAASLVE